MVVIPSPPVSLIGCMTLSSRIIKEDVYYACLKGKRFWEEFLTDAKWCSTKDELSWALKSGILFA